MTCIYAAIILGVFFLLGIILHHWLRSNGSLTAMLKGASASISWQSLAFAVALLAYFTFTVLLLVSTGEDRNAGLLFLINSIVLIIGGLLLLKRKAKMFVIYCIAGLLQTGILIIMLLYDWGTTSIVATINACIIIGFCVLAWLTARGQPMSK